MARDHDAKNRRLAAIVFTDIVGFSAMVNRNEVRGAQALDLQRRIVRRLVTSFGGREIETAGDSFLLEFTGAFAALRCVVAIQQALKAEQLAKPGDPPVQLRASIHLGDIEHRGREVFGDGVNIAARLMPMSPEGGIAISDQVHSQVRHRLDVSARSLGPCELKNIRYPVEVFVLDAKAVEAIPVEVPGAAQSKRSRPAGQGWARFAVAALLAVMLFGAGVFAMRESTRPPASAEAGSHRRIAVLPFASFSNGPDDDMLAAGLQDSILTNLARTADLRVISRTSVMQYKSSATRKLKDIATELSVDAIIEGSLQRKGDRLLVQVQLIDVATDQHIWAQSYDRKVDDLFDVESTVSREVAHAVKVQLTEPLRNVIDARPTSSVEAYAEYQRALQIDNGDYDRLPEVQKHVSRALDLDPDFALAHLLQSHLHVLSYSLDQDRSDARLAMAKQSLIRAAELRPDLPELHRAWGFFYFYGRRDLEAAGAEYEKALQLMPNDAETLAALGSLYQEQDRLGEALLCQRRAVELDPNFFDGRIQLLSTLELMRDYSGALKELDLAARIDPKSLAVPIYRARLVLAETGDVARAMEHMKGVDYAPALERFAYYAGDLDESMRLLRMGPEWVNNGNYGAASYPALASMALDLWLKGDHAEAEKLYLKVAHLLELALKTPDSAQWDRQTTLATAYAAIGRKEDARTLIDTVLRDECCKSPVTRAAIRSNIAIVEIMLGDRAAAISSIEHLLAEPSNLSWRVVAIDPAWRSLRSDPAFIQMLDRARASTGTTAS